MYDVAISIRARAAAENTNRDDENDYWMRAKILTIEIPTCPTS